MQAFWKFFWDIAAVIFGGFAGWKVFLYLGDLIPGFGYFPLGVMAGLLTLGVVARFVHFIELPLDWIIWKTLKVRMAESLPFD